MQGLNNGGAYPQSLSAAEEEPGKGERRWAASEPNEVMLVGPHAVETELLSSFGIGDCIVEYCLVRLLRVVGG
jgi:hypothetical protein